MAVYRCKECSYFLCDSNVKDGSARMVCRRCKKSQRIEFGKDAERDEARPPSHLQAAGI